MNGVFTNTNGAETDRVAFMAEALSAKQLLRDRPPMFVVGVCQLLKGLQSFPGTIRDIGSGRSQQFTMSLIWKSWESCFRKLHNLETLKTSELNVKNPGHCSQKHTRHDLKPL